MTTIANLWHDIKVNSELLANEDLPAELKDRYAKELVKLNAEFEQIQRALSGNVTVELSSKFQHVKVQVPALDLKGFCEANAGGIYDSTQLVLQRDFTDKLYALKYEADETFFLCVPAPAEPVEDVDVDRLVERYFTL